MAQAQGRGTRLPRRTSALLEHASTAEEIRGRSRHHLLAIPTLRSNQRGAAGGAALRNRFLNRQVCGTLRGIAELKSRSDALLPTLPQPSRRQSVDYLGRLSSCASFVSAAEPKLRFGQQAALHTESVTDRSSSSATMSDQNLTKELSASLLRLKRLLELLLRDQLHLDQDLPQ